MNAGVPYNLHPQRVHKECIKKKILKVAEEPDTYYFSELPSLTEEQYQMSKSILETQIENPAV